MTQPYFYLIGVFLHENFSESAQPAFLRVRHAALYLDDVLLCSGDVMRVGGGRKDKSASSLSLSLSLSLPLFMEVATMPGLQ